MGAWGIAVSSNDTYADVYGAFFDYFDKGLDVPEISARLTALHEETLNDPVDAGNFYFALAKAQWECKQLDPELYSKVATIIKSGSDIDAWRQLDASAKDLKRRATALRAFLTKLSTEKPKSRRRKKQIVRQPIFEKGECIVFRLANGNYGGAVVLEAKAMVGFGLNLVATTRINQPNQPTIDDFVNSQILILNFANWNDAVRITWKYSIKFRAERHLFAEVGQLSVGPDFDPNDYLAGYSYGAGWKDIIDCANLQFESETTMPPPARKIKVKKVIKSRDWKFW